MTQAKAASGAVTTCDDTYLAAALSSGGLVTFNCGPAKLTVTSLKINAADTTIDGLNKGQPRTLTRLIEPTAVDEHKPDDATRLQRLAEQFHFSQTTPRLF